MYKLRFEESDAYASVKTPIFRDNFLIHIQPYRNFVLQVDGRQVTNLIYVRYAILKTIDDKTLVLEFGNEGLLTKIELTADFIHTHDVRFFYINDGSSDDLKKALTLDEEWGYPLIDFLEDQLHSISYGTVAWRADITDDNEATYEYWFNEEDPKDVIIEGDVPNAEWIRITKDPCGLFKLKAMTKDEVIHSGVDEDDFNIWSIPVRNDLPDGTESYIIHHSFFRHEGGATEDDN